VADELLEDVVAWNVHVFARSTRTDDRPILARLAQTVEVSPR